MDDTTNAVPDGDKQREIDYVRGEQLGLLRKCTLPTTPGDDDQPVSNSSMKAVLNAIDSYAGKSGTCFASADTLAEHTGLARRTVLRSLFALRTLKLIIEARDESNKRLLHRRICFPNLEDFQTPIRRERKSRTSGTGATTGTDPSTGTGASVELIGATEETIGATGEQTGATSGTLRFIKATEGINERIHTGGMNESSEVGERKNSWGTLRPGIIARHLNDPEEIEELWQLCISESPVKSLYRGDDDERRLFFALAKQCFENRNKLASAIGFFHCLIGQGPAAIRVQVSRDSHLDWAKHAIERLDREPAFLARTPVIDDESQQAREFEQRRSEQMRRLWEEARKNGEVIS